jgi:hypothetical protein
LWTAKRTTTPQTFCRVPLFPFGFPAGVANGDVGTRIVSVIIHGHPVHFNMPRGMRVIRDVECHAMSSFAESGGSVGRANTVFERVTCASPAGAFRGFETYFFWVTVTGTVPAFRACE